MFLHFLLYRWLNSGISGSLWPSRESTRSTPDSTMNSTTQLHPQSFSRSIPQPSIHAGRDAFTSLLSARVRFPSTQRRCKRICMPFRRWAPGSGIVSKLENETDANAPSRPPKIAAPELSERNALPGIQGQPVRRPLSDDEKERRIIMENELKDSKNFFDYLAPRPLRRSVRVRMLSHYKNNVKQKDWSYVHPPYHMYRVACTIIAAMLRSKLSGRKTIFTAPVDVVAGSTLHLELHRAQSRFSHLWQKLSQIRVFRYADLSHHSPPISFLPHLTWLSVRWLPWHNTNIPTDRSCQSN